MSPLQLCLHSPCSCNTRKQYREGRCYCVLYNYIIFFREHNTICLLPLHCHLPVHYLRPLPAYCSPLQCYCPGLPPLLLPFYFYYFTGAISSPPAWFFFCSHLWWEVGACELDIFFVISLCYLQIRLRLTPRYHS